MIRKIKAIIIFCGKSLLFLWSVSILGLAGYGGYHLYLHQFKGQQIRLPWIGQNPQPDSKFLQARIKRVIDGDTVVITLAEPSRQERKIRLIGIDSPESRGSQKLNRDARRSGIKKQRLKAMGRKSTRFVQKLLYEGQPIQLELGQEAQDRYGRTLAYIWLTDGSMLNRQILQAGYAKTMSIPPNTKYLESFNQAEKTARNQKKGLWKELAQVW